MNTDYWESRALYRESLTQKKTEETVKAVNEVYDKAIEILEEKVKTVFDRYATGYNLTESEALKKLNYKQTKKLREELLAQLAQAETEEEKERLKAILNAPAYANRITRIEALANEIYAEALSLGALENREIQKRLISAYNYNYYRTTFDLQQEEGEYYNFQKVSSGRLKEALSHKWSGKNYSQRVWENTDITAEKLKKVVLTGMMSGQGYKEMTDSLMAVLGENPNEGARHRFSRLVRTEVNYISGQATQRAYEEAGIDEYIFLATLDKRTCHGCGDEKRKSCAELDGKVFKISEAKVGVNKHPMHPYCRCTDMPNTGKTIKRAARDERGKTIFVPSDMTYSQWYGKYVGENGVDNENRINYNLSVDDEQYLRYKSVLKELCPKTFDEFFKIKHNDEKKWATLKSEYRILNRYKIDSGNFTTREILELDRITIMEKRKKFTSKHNSSGNIASAYINNDKSNMYFSHSHLADTAKGYKGEANLVLLKSDRRFTYIDVCSNGGKNRQKTYYDTEAKLFENFADLYEKQPFKTITMLSERGMCDSCKGVMEQFKKEFPNVTVNVVSNKKTIGDVWKHRWKK